MDDTSDALSERLLMNEFDQVCFRLHDVLGVDEKRALEFVAHGIGVNIGSETRFESTILDLETTIRHRLSPTAAQSESFTFLYHAIKEVLQVLGKPAVVTQTIEDIFDPIRPQLLQPYQLKVSYPKVDYRLVVLEFLYKLKQDDYTLLTRFICSKLHFNCDRFARRCDLANELFCRQFLPSTISSPDDITPLYKISISFDHDQLFFDLCERQGLSVPDIDRQLIIVRRRSQLLEEVFAFINVPQKQKCSYPSLKQICWLLFVIIMVVVIAVVGGVISEHYTHPTVSAGSILTITAQSVVNIYNDGFEANLGAIDLLLLNTTNTVNVYKTDCSKIVYSTTNVSSDPPSYPSHLKFFNRQIFNKGDSFSGIKGSYIDFHVTARLTNPRYNSNCWLKVRIFDNYDDFNKAKTLDDQREVKGTYNMSGCLSLNDTWRYTFNTTTTQSLYATLDVEAYVSVTKYFTGKLVNYDTHSLTKVTDCFHPLQDDSSTRNQHCSIDICGDLICSSRGNSTCILVENLSNTRLQLMFEAYWPKYSVQFLVSVAVSGVILIVTLIIYVIVCCCLRRKQCCQRRQHTRRGDCDIGYIPVLNDSDIVKTI